MYLPTLIPPYLANSGFEAAHSHLVPPVGPEQIKIGGKGEHHHEDYADIEAGRRKDLKEPETARLSFLVTSRLFSGSSRTPGYEVVDDEDQRIRDQKRGDQLIGLPLHPEEPRQTCD